MTDNLSGMGSPLKGIWKKKGNANPERLWKLAQRIEEKQLWAGYLSEQEHIIWRKALQRKDTWDDFLLGHGEDTESMENHNIGGDVNGLLTKTGDNAGKVTDPVSTAFRARFMLSEASVRNLFPSQTPDNWTEILINDTSDTTHEDNPVLGKKPTIRYLEEDNYDDEKEEVTEAAIAILDLSYQEPTMSTNNFGEASRNETDLRYNPASTSNQLVSNRFVLSYP
jgi:hypothetical protein